MNKIKIFCIMLSFSIVCNTITPQTAFSEQLSSKSLQNSINYYHKTSREQALSKNDRYYILMKIEKKYENSGVDLAPLMIEFNKLEELPAVNESASRQKNTQTDKNNSNTIDKILIKENPGSSQIVINVKNVKRSNSFILRDPDPDKPVKIILDLYGVKDNLPSASKNITTKTGIFSNITCVQFEDSPELIVRISAEMRQERPYKIINSDDEWVITADKGITTKPETQQKQIIHEQKTVERNSFPIEVGDILGVSIYPAEELSRELIVQPDENISFPMIGTIKAKGLTTTQLSDKMEKSLAKFVSNPKVIISVKKFSRRQIFITGQVKSVGSFEYKDNLRLTEFISSLGGFNSDANRREIKIYRGPASKRETHYVNVEEIIKTGDFSKDFLLEPGDIIEVPKGYDNVSILGDISKPGFYEWRDNIQLLELISLAGGYNTDNANINKISLIRIDSNNNKTITKINLENILSGNDKDVPLKAGDTVYIPRKSILKANWFLTVVMPWVSIITLIIALRK